MSMKDEMKKQIGEAWKNYMLFADPAVKARFASEYCKLKEQYVHFFGEEEEED